MFEQISDNPEPQTQNQLRKILWGCKHNTTTNPQKQD